MDGVEIASMIGSEPPPYLGALRAPEGVSKIHGDDEATIWQMSFLCVCWERLYGKFAARPDMGEPDMIVSSGPDTRHVRLRAVSSEGEVLCVVQHRCVMGN